MSRSPAIGPGEIALTVTPLGPNSRASALVSPQTPCFAAEICAPSGLPMIAFIPVKLTMRPQPCAIMPGRNAREKCIAALKDVLR